MSYCALSGLQLPQATLRGFRSTAAVHDRPAHPSEQCQNMKGLRPPGFKLLPSSDELVQLCKSHFVLQNQFTDARAGEFAEKRQPTKGPVRQHLTQSEDCPGGASVN